MARPNSRYFAGVINKIKASKKQENIAADQAFKAQLKEDLMRRAALGAVVTEESGFAAFFSRWRYQLLAVPAALVLLIVVVQAFKLVVPMQSDEVLTEVPAEREEVVVEEEEIVEEAEESVIPIVEEEEDLIIEYPKIVTFPGRLALPLEEEEETEIEPFVTVSPVEEPVVEVEQQPAPEPVVQPAEPVYVPVPEPVPSQLPVNVPLPAMTYPQASVPVYRPYVPGNVDYSDEDEEEDESFESSSGSNAQPTGGFVRVFEPEQMVSGGFVAIASSAGSTGAGAQSENHYYTASVEGVEESEAIEDLEDKIEIDEVLHGQYLIFFDAPWLNTIQKKAFAAEVVEPMAGCPDNVDYVYIYTCGLNTLRVVVVHENGKESKGTFRLNPITNQWENLNCCHYNLG
jgi:hypothetical protein